MKLKERWTKSPIWLKGGLIAVFVILILTIIGSTCFFSLVLLSKAGIILNVGDFMNPVCMPFLSIPILFSTATTLEFALVPILISIVISFLFGAGIGSIISWKRQSFNLDNRVWLKGGLIGSIIGLIISFIGFFLIGHYEGMNVLANLSGLDNLGDFFKYGDIFGIIIFFRTLFKELSGILVCFIPGAIIGLFTEKIKKANKKSLLHFAFLGGTFGLFLYFIVGLVFEFLKEELTTWRYALILFAPEFIKKIFNLIIYPFCTLTAERGESQAYCIFFIGHITNIIIYALIFVIIGILIKKFKR